MYLQLDDQVLVTNSYVSKYRNNAKHNLDHDYENVYDYDSFYGIVDFFNKILRTINVYCYQMIYYNSFILIYILLII